MCSRGSIKTVAGLFLLMSLLPGCGNNSNNISISSNAISINNASIEASVEANIEASVSDNEVADEAGDNTAISDSSSLNAVSDAVDIKNAKPGDIIVLGEYEQDGDQGKDPIEWIVLDEYEDTITDEEDDEVRILRHVKSSLAPKGKDTFFKITNNSLIEWTEKEMPTEQSGNQSIEKVQILKTDKQTEIAERIKDLLADGPQNSKEMVEQLSLLGVSKRTIMSVKGILGIQSKRIDGTWFWCLPETGSDIDGQKI